MSKQEMERFEAALRTDEGLVKALRSEARDLESAVAFARGRGFDITAEEALAEPASDRLTDEELDAVSGGMNLGFVNIDLGTFLKNLPHVASQVGNAVSDAGNTLENWGKIYVLGDPTPPDD